MWSTRQRHAQRIGRARYVAVVCYSFRAHQLTATVPSTSRAATSASERNEPDSKLDDLQRRNRPRRPC
jgi:hypothetical protein